MKTRTRNTLLLFLGLITLVSLIACSPAATQTPSADLPAYKEVATPAPITVASGTSIKVADVTNTKWAKLTYNSDGTWSCETNNNNGFAGCVSVVDATTNFFWNTGEKFATDSNSSGVVQLLDGWTQQTE